jgi:hypothetical protein
MVLVVLMFLLAVCVFAVKNWRHGFALCVAAALIQDPLRKLVPGQPVYFVLFVAVVFAAAWLGALLHRIPLGPVEMIGWRRYVGLPFVLFISLVALQAVHSLVVYQNPMMTGIGLVSYLAPIPAIALAYRFALSRGEVGVERWMKFYVILATIALATVYLEYAGVTSVLLGEVGGGVLLYGNDGFYRGNAGTFRATEIAAWHAAAVASFGFILFRGRRFTPPRFVLAALFLLFLLGIGVLTGRRKMIVEIAIFLGCYFFLQGWFRRGNTRLAIMSAALGVLAAISAALLIPADQQLSPARVQAVEYSEFSKYSNRAKSVFEEVPGRVLELGVKPVSWAVDQYGWFGAGLGIGSQGAQHFGAQTSGAAEGGLGKLTVELGVPGLLLAGWLGLAFFRYISALLSVLSETSPRHSNLAFGIVSFIAANIAAFSVATQAFGDLFILLILGWCFGFLVALPLLARAEMAQPPVPARPRMAFAN